MKKHLCLFLTLLLTILPLSAKNQQLFSDNGTVENVNSIYKKIHFYHDGSYININDENEFQYALSSLKTVFINNNVEEFTTNSTEDSTNDNTICLLLELDNNIHSSDEYHELLSERTELTDADSVHEWRSRLNEYASKYHEDILYEYQKELDLTAYDSYQFMKYTPFITLTININELTEEHILELANQSFVTSISLSTLPQLSTDSIEMQTNSDTVTWQENLSDINASSIVNSRTYNGTGVRVGIFESGGVCDIEHENFANIDITRHSDTAATTVHATRVTSVLTAIAPNAEYYVARVRDVSSSSCDLSWFIDNACDIINCSFSYENDLSYTSQYDGYFDYISQTYCVTIIKSAGNTATIPSKKIGSPGYAYNVITVGGVSRTTIDSIEYLQYDEGACYISDSGQTIKPDIAAPFYVDIQNIGVWFGTSYATPIVSGCVALLYDKFNNYMPYPELTKSLIASTATKTNDYEETNGGLDEKVGAGCINLNRMLNCTSYTRKFVTTDAYTYDVHSQNIYLSSGQTINTAISWLITATATGTSRYVTDYDLYVYNSAGTVVAKSTIGTKSNVELVRYTATAAGTYTIKVSMIGGQNSNIDSDCVVLTYNTQ